MSRCLLFDYVSQARCYLVGQSQPVLGKREFQLDSCTLREM